MLLQIQDCQILEDRKWTKNQKKYRQVEFLIKTGERESTKLRLSADYDAPGLDEQPFQTPIKEIILEVDNVNYRKDGKDNQFMLIKSVATPKAKS